MLMQTAEFKDVSKNRAQSLQVITMEELSMLSFKVLWCFSSYHSFLQLKGTTVQHGASEAQIDGLVSNYIIPKRLWSLDPLIEWTF